MHKYDMLLARQNTKIGMERALSLQHHVANSPRPPRFRATRFPYHQDFVVYKDDMLMRCKKIPW